MPDETTSSALVLLKTVSVNVRFDGSLYALIICFPVGRPFGFWYFFFPSSGWTCLVLERASLDHRVIPTGFVRVLGSSISLKTKTFRGFLLHLDAKLRYRIVGVHTSP